MDCEEARKIRKNPKVREVSIQRFAYDVFSYMLPLCGFPKTTISNTNIERNDYRDKDFVKKSALSVLPLSMFVRDDWKKMFELRHSITGFNSLKIIQNYIISNLTRNGDFRNSDDATKVRVSLAFFSEITLFFNYKGFETYIDKLPEFWCDFYLEHIATNQDIEGFFASSFFMFPEATESKEWMIDFVEKFAVPYGRLNNVSRMFSVYSIASKDSKSSPLKKTPTNNKINSSSDMPEAPADGSFLENTNLSSTLKSNHGFPASSVSPSKLGIDEAFGRMSLDNERVSQELILLETNNSSDIPEAPADASFLGNTNLSSTLKSNHGFSGSPSELEIDEAFGQMSLNSERVPKEFLLRETIHENADKKEDK